MSCRLREDEEAAARDRWKNIVSFCKHHGDPFVDDSFPPTSRSLYYNGREPCAEAEPSREPGHGVSQVGALLHALVEGRGGAQESRQGLGTKQKQTLALGSN